MFGFHNKFDLSESIILSTLRRKVEVLLECRFRVVNLIGPSNEYKKLIYDRFLGNLFRMLDNKSEITSKTLY